MITNIAYILRKHTSSTQLLSLLDSLLAKPHTLSKPPHDLSKLPDWMDARPAKNDHYKSTIRSSIAPLKEYLNDDRELFRETRRLGKRA